MRFCVGVWGVIPISTRENYKGSGLMRRAICDDEKNIRELIANKVAKQYPDAEIIFFQS